MNLNIYIIFGTQSQKSERERIDMISKNLKHFITHGGTFHADEVFCTALLEIYLERLLMT